MTALPSSKKHKRNWLLYLVAVGIIVLITLGLRPQPSPVETAPAITGPLRATVSEEGKTRIRQRYVVSAPVSGQLRRIPLKPGALVETGVTIVAVIDPLAASPLDARNRALAVRDYLHQKQLPVQTLIRVSFKGACCYVAGNDTEEGRAANRRVEIEIKRAPATYAWE